MAVGGSSNRRKVILNEVVLHLMAPGVEESCGGEGPMEITIFPDGW